MGTRFIVDINVGKLAKWLRIMGYNTLLFTDQDGGKMISIALNQHRVILTKDTQIMKRRLITSGKLEAILIEGDDPKDQLRQVANVLNLKYQSKPFSLCLECNQKLYKTDKDKVTNIVPPYVYKTQNDYMECPSCHRIYWQGTHWLAMKKELETIMVEKQNV
ncbi:Mut7-C RNAse domain-containing protein [Chloroflexota bacterium]